MSKANHQEPRWKRRAWKVLVWIMGVVAVVGAGIYVASRVSPWPAALLIRRAFDEAGARTSRALEKHVPPGVSARLNERYDAADDDARLDVFYPAEMEGSGRSLPTIVWVHGGGWVSGNKEGIANYAKILASKGYTVVGVDYSIAPGKTYPLPLRQVNAALSYLVSNAARLHVDTSRFFLAGDSAGSHIAAQLANVITVPSYASEVRVKPSIERSQLRGVMLFCGAYDVGRVNLSGSFGGFLRTMLWSYSGSKDFRNAPGFETASVINYVTPEFPPAFISVGNTDPLEPQSHAFAEALVARGVSVDTLFFPEDYKPPLGHEYQFDLDTDAGQLALQRGVAFLSTH